MEGSRNVSITGGRTKTSPPGRSATKVTQIDAFNLALSLSNSGYQILVGSRTKSATTQAYLITSSASSLSCKFLKLLLAVPAICILRPLRRQPACPTLCTPTSTTTWPIPQPYRPPPPFEPSFTTTTISIIPFFHSSVSCH
ncbi:hypothetical protein P691DRAFT_594782 [Macrolepiota fuliginosa MF-IS2]|uniref:Uncharacterized protein n=1 Tax=Macrolepiota fuliginosa MF-IS2 TaxID=1400762 RepID=A0A9P5WYI0_9AGAR|nr:hypothetical protein P691DRAFT_594782 [Macrolepiota fuliginosa MF-IS2]